MSVNPTNFHVHQDQKVLPANSLLNTLPLFVKIYLHLLGEEDTIIEVGNMAALEKTTLEQVGQIKLRKLELNKSHQ